MLLVGLTGGLGAGKSTVARMLAARGAVVVDADELARRAVEPGTEAHRRVVDAFGPGVVDAEGRVDRATLARAVFADEERRRALEAIVHPEVFRMLGEELDRLRGTDAVVVFDAALLVESGFHGACDLVVVVSAPEEQRLARVTARGMDEAEARARIAAQAGPEERRAAADVVIENDRDLVALEAQVDALWRRLRDAAAGPA